MSLQDNESVDVVPPSPSASKIGLASSSSSSRIASTPASKTPSNSHPYSFVSTSSALLSRSNSSSSGRHNMHFYQPATPPLSRSQSNGHGHRHTKSLSNAPIPTPLPMPPSQSGTPSRRSSVDDATLGRGAAQARRSDTMPSFSTSNSSTESSIADLPDNPKTWSPSQLSLYLNSSLRFRRGGSIPIPIAKDIAAFVLKEKLIGRRFLRLTEEDLKSMGLNQLWREALLDASRNLRKKVLKGRIWGFGNSMTQEPGSDSETGTKYRIPSTVNEGSESESVPATTKYRRGRVRGMVESFERSSSTSGSERADSPVDENLSPQDSRIMAELKAAGLWFEDDDEPVGDLSSDLSASEEEQVVSTIKGRPSLTDSISATAVDLNDDTELTVEELLAQEGISSKDMARGKPAKNHGRLESLGEKPSWGAQAWERADALTNNETFKKLPTKSTQRGSLSQSTSMPLSDVFTPMEDKTSLINTTILSDLKTRLELVEKRLLELEIRDNERERELELYKQKARLLETQQASIVQESYTPPNTDGDSQPFRATKKKSTRGSNRVSFLEEEPEAEKNVTIRRRRNGSSTSAHEGAKENDNSPEDPSPGELPSYIFLVSMGVCAVVLRVMFRKLTGGERR